MTCQYCGGNQFVRDTDSQNWIACPQCNKPTCKNCGGTKSIVIFNPDGNKSVPCPYCAAESVIELGSNDIPPATPQGIIDAEIRREHGSALLHKYGPNFADNLTGFTQIVSQLNSLWEVDLEGNPIEPDFPEMLMLVVCECAEAMEGFRKDAMDKRHPTRKNFDVEIGDAIIRLFHIAARKRIDIGAVIVEILHHNVVRPDHQWAERIKRHGKKI